PFVGIVYCPRMTLHVAVKCASTSDHLKRTARPSLKWTRRPDRSQASTVRGLIASRRPTSALVMYGSPAASAGLIGGCFVFFMTRCQLRFVRAGSGHLHAARCAHFLCSTVF